VDLRLLVPAGAGWMTAVLLVGQRPLVSVCTAVAAFGLMISLLLIHVRARRRVAGPWSGPSDGERSGGGRVVVTAAAVGVVVVGMALAAGLQVEGLRAGPVMELGRSEAAVKVRLKVDGDPSVRNGSGNRRPPYVVVRATVEEVTGRGETTRVRTPVLVIGSISWQHVRFGQHLEATGRLESVDSGSDVAAMLSSRVPPRVLDEPAWWLRAAERVRAGLREAVAHEPDAVRGLVPALVMGDESGLPPELAEDFKTTGLTHLSAVSGTNVGSRDGCPSSTAALARRPLCWRPAAIAPEPPLERSLIPSGQPARALCGVCAAPNRTKGS
jgi:competence protein ComEC